MSAQADQACGAEYGERSGARTNQRSRKYHSFPLPGVEIYDEGVFFRDSQGKEIINYLNSIRKREA